MCSMAYFYTLRVYFIDIFTFENLMSGRDFYEIITRQVQALENNILQHVRAEPT